jgi:maltose-binding protein MalE
MKKIINLFVIVFLLVILIACQKDDRTHLNFYVWGDSVEVSWYERIAQDFYEESGIEVRILPSTGNYYENLNIYLGSRKNAPDIFFTEQGEILSQLSTGRILDLTPYITSGALDIVSPDNPDGEIELWNINDAYKFDGESFGEGSYYALIKDWSPDFMMWYNKDHIDQYNQVNDFDENDDEFMHYPSETIPLSWSEFMDMSYKLTIKDGTTITRYGTMLDRVPWKHLFQMIQAGGDTPFIDGKYFNHESDAVKEAFTYFSELQRGNLASAPTIGPSGIGSGEAFANGNLSFAWFGSWAYSAFSFDNVSFNLGIAPPPVPDSENITEASNYGVAAGMIALGINESSPLKDEAILFLNYYMTKGQEFMAERGFNIPGNLKVAESDIYLNPEDSFLRYMNNYFFNYAINHTHPLILNNHISQIAIETQIAKNFDTFISNYNINQIDQLLSNIESDIRNEIG